jgi:hypothetical protein
MKVVLLCTHIRFNRIQATNNSIRKQCTMSLKTVASQFVELCNQGKNFDTRLDRIGATNRSS